MAAAAARPVPRRKGGYSLERRLFLRLDDHFVLTFTFLLSIGFFFLLISLICIYTIRVYTFCSFSFFSYLFVTLSVLSSRTLISSVYCLVTFTTTLLSFCFFSLVFFVPLFYFGSIRVLPSWSILRFFLFSGIKWGNCFFCHFILSFHLYIIHCIAIHCILHIYAHCHTPRCSVHTGFRTAGCNAEWLARIRLRDGLLESAVAVQKNMPPRPCSRT